MTITAWILNTEVSDLDQRMAGHYEPNKDVSMDTLAQLGVLHWSGITGPDDPLLNEIRATRGYSYFDIVNIAPGKLPDYDNKLKSFFREHIHYDEEIRYCVEGSGYFDVRGFEDEWIRVSLQAGDMIILPGNLLIFNLCMNRLFLMIFVICFADLLIIEGIYHRFTPDQSNYIQAMRLFVGEPVWTPYNRDELDEKTNVSRRKYVDTFLAPSC
jgi:1,2-dihydroxy-3-keto-5-methylthiopentene dioxygenase